MPGFAQEAPGFSRGESSQWLRLLGTASPFKSGDEDGETRMVKGADAFMERDRRDGACVFCAIVAGSEPASMVFSDEQVVAFMSLEQPNPYKVLVIPRQHVPTIYDLSDEQAGYVFRAAVRVARGIRAVSGCEGLNVVQANGRVGQQDVFHFHLHLIPRVSGDRMAGRIVLGWDDTPSERAELDRLASALRARLLPAGD